jgi:hypothetical protein
MVMDWYRNGRATLPKYVETDASERAVRPSSSQASWHIYECSSGGQECISSKARTLALGGHARKTCKMTREWRHSRHA